jgi:putative transposase
MARPPRLELPGGVHQVVVRGNERAAVFRDDEDREKYLGRLADTTENSSVFPNSPGFQD